MVLLCFTMLLIWNSVIKLFHHGSPAAPQFTCWHSAGSWCLLMIFRVVLTEVKDFVSHNRVPGFESWSTSNLCSLLMYTLRAAVMCQAFVSTLPAQDTQTALWIPCFSLAHTWMLGPLERQTSEGKFVSVSTHLSPPILLIKWEKKSFKIS